MRISGALSPETVDREVSTEIAFHLDMRIAQLVESGASPEEARRIAAAEFGTSNAATPAGFRPSSRSRRTRVTGGA
jgi:hypothetical protein